jgi:hypothetical protein
MVDFVLYGGLPSLNFTLVVDLEIWGFLAPSLGVWVFGILAFLPLLWGVDVHRF